MSQLELYTSDLEYSYVKAVVGGEAATARGSTQVPPGPPKHPSFTNYNTPKGERIRLISFRNRQFSGWQDQDGEILLPQLSPLLNHLSVDERSELWDDKWYIVTTQKGRQTVRQSDSQTVRQSDSQTGV